MNHRNNVQVYLIDKSEMQVLLLKRVSSKSGYWQPVCGGVEKSESKEDAALRELREETGVSDKYKLIKLPLEFDYIETKNNEMMSMTDNCFVVILERKVDIKLSLEHETFIWCGIKEVSNYTDWHPILKSVEYIKNNYL
ncbi:NUDIX domain-containing protein [Clostridiaceae bacterium M8S5]|nr:NUDIX domain-containing protein [Clostridiaceae bacterium M8S5]